MTKEERLKRIEKLENDLEFVETCLCGADDDDEFRVLNEKRQDLDYEIEELRDGLA